LPKAPNRKSCYNLKAADAPVAHLRRHHAPICDADESLALSIAVEHFKHFEPRHKLGHALRITGQRLFYTPHFSRRKISLLPILGARASA